MWQIVLNVHNGCFKLENGWPYSILYWRWYMAAILDLHTKKQQNKQQTSCLLVFFKSTVNCINKTYLFIFTHDISLIFYFNYVFFKNPFYLRYFVATLYQVTSHSNTECIPHYIISKNNLYMLELKTAIICWRRTTSFMPKRYKYVIRIILWCTVRVDNSWRSHRMTQLAQQPHSATDNNNYYYCIHKQNIRAANFNALTQIDKITVSEIRLAEVG